mmetsp:Transcript_30881/g.58624  ORF Transcript_30881/g.58624 Transcript_30881/m.58624 type:complete len:329 (-) Transcript_30881:788-1774(-)
MSSSSSSSQLIPPFDLQAYISRYDPHSETHLQRLLFLAHHFHNEAHDNNDRQGSGVSGGVVGVGGGVGVGGISNTSTTTGSNNDANIALQAFTLAVHRMKATGNHRRYLEEYGAITNIELPNGGNTHSPNTNPEEFHERNSPNNSNINNTSNTSSNVNRARSNSHSSHAAQRHVIHRYLEYDAEFARRSKVDATSRSETMEARLATAQSHLMKESIRTALLALAEFHRERGELREAWRRVARSRRMVQRTRHDLPRRTHRHGRRRRNSPLPPEATRGRGVGAPRRGTVPGGGRGIRLRFPRVDESVSRRDGGGGFGNVRELVGVGHLG